MWQEDLKEPRTIEVRVYEDGRFVHRELCESEEDAALVAGEWAEHGGVSCEVEDLATRHRPGDILEPEPAELSNDDYAPDPAR